VFYRQRVPIGRNERVVDSKSGVFSIQVREGVIVEYPTIVEKAERFLGEMLLDGFDFKLYDSTNPADIIDADGHPIVLAPQNNYKLFTTWMRPLREVDLYCRIEIRENGNADFEEMVTGVLKTAVTGQDITLEHEQDHNQYLNDQTNREINTERVFAMKFIPIQMNGLARVPRAMTKNVGSGYDVNFWTATNGVTPDYPPEADGAAMLVVPCVAGDNTGTPFTYTNLSGQVVNARWNRHISVYEWLKLAFNEAYGEDKWVFTCDDSPFEFAMCGLKEDMTGIDTLLQAAFVRPNFGPNQPVEKWWLLPLALWGLHDDLADGEEPHPFLENSWQKRFRSFWEQMQELCLCAGYMPLIDWDRSTTPAKVVIHFQDRTKFTRSYTTQVPYESSPEAFYESELGVAVERMKLFMNADEQQGWMDDWFAMRMGNGINDTVTRPQANSYTVPATAQKPASLQITLTMGGITNGGHIVDDGALSHLHIGWYSMSLPGYSDPFEAVRITRPRTTENWPTTTPLMSLGLLAHALDPTLGVNHRPVLFGPVIKGRFAFTKTDGSTSNHICVSFRQLLARFYATWFVRSDAKSRRKYGTITQFTNPSNGTITWRNVKPYYTTQVPVTEADAEITTTHWCMGVRRIIGTNDTEVEGQQIVRTNSYFDGGWQDDDLVTGNTPGLPPEDDPKDPPRGRGTA
jgi:hypothetical protein